MGKKKARASADRSPTAATTSLAHANKLLGAELHALQQRQQTLERSHARYVELFDFSPVTYVLLNSVGVIVNLSMAGCRLLGRDRKQLVGHPLLAFVSPQDQREFLEHLRRSRGSTGTVESELRFISGSGEAVVCRLYTKATMYEDYQALPTMIVDQTETRALDRARLAAERQKDEAERQAAIAQAANHTKDRFLATVSHELRTPLAPALIAATRLASWTEIPEDAQRLAATIKRNIEREARLIDDLLDVARVSENLVELKLQTVDLHEILRETIEICEPIADVANIAVTLRQMAEMHHVKGDPSRLRQVFWNLLNNAIKFARPGGMVVVRSVNVSDTRLCVTIHDDGVGMDQATLQMLFLPFEHKAIRKDSRGGLGLGLAICKGIVGAHGGQIWATSDGIGRGSTFGVDLATAIPEQPSVSALSQDDQERGDVPGPPAQQRPRVLLIEDDADSSEMLSLLLFHQGCDVTVADSLASATQRLAEHWDVVLSDIKLPDGSGLDVARLAQRSPHPPGRLIALTGFGSRGDIQASHDAGFDTHLVKPIDVDKLLSMIRNPAEAESRTKSSV